MQLDQAHTLFLYYDGDCFFCSRTAKALRIRKSVGELVLINARSNHPQINRLIREGYDLNEGIVIEYNNKTYFKEEALNLIAMISTSINLFNRLSVFILRRKWLAKILYPFLKTLRRLFLWLRGQSLITHEKQYPIFKPIFGSSWDALPAVFRKLYANRAYSNDKVISQGKMSIKVTGIFGVGIRQYQDIPVTVNFLSEQNSRYYIFHRTFYDDNPQKSKQFVTRLLPLKNNVTIDIMRCGFAWKAKYVLEENRVKLIHRGYVWHFCGISIPLPISLLIGKINGEEVAISDDEFSLCLELRHFIFGKLIEYAGHFKVA